MNYSQYEMLPLEIKQSGDKLLHHSVLRGGGGECFQRGYLEVFKSEKGTKMYICENLKLGLSKTNDAIWFNKMYGTKQLTPKYIRIKVSVNNTTKQEHALVGTNK
jgi:hypothetical protein